MVAINLIFNNEQTRLSQNLICIRRDYGCVSKVIKVEMSKSIIS